MANTTERVAKIREYNNKFWEVEDEYLENWLMEGCPDGATDEEIAELIDEESFSNPNNKVYEEWVELAEALLKLREEEEEN